MAEEDDGERTEEPSERRLEEARDRGQVVYSREVGTAFIFLAATGLFLFQGKTLWLALMNKMHFYFSGKIQSEMTSHSVVIILKETIQNFLLDMMPFFLLFLLAAIAAPLIQHGWIFTLEPLTPKFSKLNPLEGLGRLLSLRSLVELGKSILKMSLIAIIVYFAVADSIKNYLILAATSIPGLLQLMVDDSMEMLWRVTLFFITLAAFDYFYQKFEYIKGLRMTRQEIKDEMKQMEGDPQIRQRIRQVQREVANRRMMQEVPKATVVITNPTHYAVALRYQSGEMRAPKVVAKGQGTIALRIRDMAKENNIPTVENPPLARTLYREVGLDQLIPAELFKAVAEVLAYVYRLKRKKLGQQF